MVVKLFRESRDPVKVDSVNLMNFMLNRKHSSLIGKIEWNFVRHFSAAGYSAINRLKAAGADYAGKSKDGANLEAKARMRHKWLRELLKAWADWGIINVEIAGRTKGGQHVPYLQFVMKKGDFEYKFQLHFDIDPVPRFFFSASLYSWATGQYFDLDEDIDNGKAFQDLINHLDKIKYIIMIGLKLPTDMEESFPSGMWKLSRLDLAKDYEFGLERCLKYFDLATTVQIPKYDTVPNRRGYRVSFYPGQKDYDGPTGNPLKWSLPTHNFYHKSVELVTVVSPLHKLAVDRSMLERGIARLELQCYQGQRRKDMAEGVLWIIRDWVSRNEYVHQRHFEKAFYENDKLSSILDALIKKEKLTRHSTLIGRLLTYIAQTNGSFTYPQVCRTLKLEAPYKEAARNIIKGWQSMGLLQFTGRVYTCEQRFMNSINEGRLPQYV